MPDYSKFPRGVPDHDDDDGVAHLLESSRAPLARWAQSASILQNRERFWNYSPGKVFLGELDKQLIGVKDNRHMMTIAGNRAGKGVSAIIPNLIEYPGSVLVIDPKGENAYRTASRRGHGSAAVRKGLGQDVFVLDPFGVSKQLDMINPDSATAID